MEFYVIFKRISRNFKQVLGNFQMNFICIQSLVGNYMATSGSQLSNNRVTNDSQMGIVTQKWQTLCLFKILIMRKPQNR